MLLFRIQLMVIVCCWMMQALAFPVHPISLDVKNISLRDALFLLGKRMEHTVVLSGAVSGTVSLHFQNTSPEEVFDFLLRAHGLQVSQEGRIWYIAPVGALIKQKEEESKWRDTLENTGGLVTQVWQVHYARAEDLAAWLKDDRYSWLSKRGRIHVDGRTNTLCVEDTRARINAMTALLKKLDVPVQQISIEARLASVDSDYEQELGIRFDTIPANASAETKLEMLRQHGQFSLAVAHLPDNSLLDIKLAALENEGRGELISSPSLFTTSHQTASIEAGEEIPYQEATSSGATSVVFKKAVLSLKVTPEILPHHKVLLKLQVNQDRPSSHSVLGVPAISTRQINTQVLVANGQTVVLGGIFESNKENNGDYLPFLGKIPVLGWLFRVTHRREARRELLIFVTPRIVE